MSGSKLSTQRIEHFDELGEDKLFDMWLEIRSVRKMMKAIGYEDSEVAGAHRCFYRWLKREEGRRERWDELGEIAGHDAAESIQDVVDEATPETTNLARLKVDHLKWRAESLNSRYGRQKGGNVNVTVNTKNAWLGALQQAEQITTSDDEAIEEADYEMLESGEGS